MSINFDEYLEAQLGRRVTREEIAVAAGISVATYGRRKSDRFPAGEVIAVSRHFGLSPAKVLLDLDYLTIDEVLEAAGSDGTTISEASDLELAEALVERIRESDPSVDNNIHELRPRRDDITLDDLEGVSYVAMTRDEGDPGENHTDHDNIP